MSKTTSNIQTVMPLLADGLTIGLLFWLLPQLAHQFRTPSGVNALIVLVGYIFFGSGVFFMRKLQNKSGNSAKPAGFARQTFIVLAVLFGIGMMLFLAQQLGYLELIFTDPYSLGEGQAAAFFVFAPSAWLGVSLIYIPILAFRVTPYVAPDTHRYTVQSLYSLLTMNVMLLLAAAQLRALLVDGGVGWFVLVLLLLLVWFGPPRWLYSEKQASSFPLITFIVLVLVVCWQVVA
ncbi:MAG: hypothetical protein H6658_10500 [Ardenticatenaceae bacterium]|nr:hypothetical protein [Ardenticatenaceae bacterium]